MGAGEEEWDTTDINLKGTWAATTWRSPHLATRRGGALVLISSMVGLRGGSFA